MQTLSSQVKPLLLSSNASIHGSISSYEMLANYLPTCEKLFTSHRSTTQIHTRILSRLLRTFAVSSWYQLSSARLEFLAWRRSRSRKYSPIHILWGERDLGYLDHLNNAALNPLCCTFHACSDDLPNIFYSPERLKNLSAIVIVSETQRQFFETCGVKPERIHCIPLGVNTNFFTPKQSEQSQQPFTVLSVGNYRRNFPLLREVFQRLEKNSEICIKVVSSRANSHYFADLKNVQFMSNLSDGQLLEVYQSASCQIVAVENATANNALLEGLACGLPTITAKIGGIEEYASEACAIFVENQPEAFAEAISMLANRPAKWAEMAKSARQRALELEWSNVAKQVETLYLSLL
ncbi:glycosyltransferase family 4 protein [Leptolyngbya sp. FACHB-17]|nr:glycosyltransferase family 4 protein [Leptolyngbya sp. FACHB-17]